MIKIAIAGASGRMGKMLIEATLASPDLTLVGAMVRADCPSASKAVQGIDNVYYSADMNSLKEADVIIDFSRPELTRQLLDFCVEHHIHLVIGTTGFSLDDRALIAKAASSIGIVFAPNMSVGVNTSFKLLEVAAKLLPNYDVEIVEMHHKHKVDAPSGTALEMGRVIAKARGVNFDDVAVLSREGYTGERVEGSIGFASLRGGDVVGDHTVIFAGLGERIEISHKSSSRAGYAQGSMLAARFLMSHPVGQYGMSDVIGIE